MTLSNSINASSGGFPFDLSRNTGDYNGPMMYNREFINIARDMRMNEVANGFQKAVELELMLVSGLANTRAISKYVIKPTAKAIWQYRATIGAFGESLLPTPFPIAKNLPGLAASTILLINFPNSPSVTPPYVDKTPFAVPDNTRVGR